MPIKPTEKEEEYFVRMEFERNMNLVEIEYHSIKADRCSACGGVWLEKGELKAVTDLDKSLLDKT